MVGSLFRARIHLMEAATKPGTKGAQRSPVSLARIAVGVDGFPEGNDAIVLGMALAGATKAELLLIAVHSDPLVLPPFGVNWSNLRKEAHAMLRKAREAHAPKARIVVETDLSVPRALQRVVHRERRDLLVMGSSRHGPEGKVRIGKRTRQLLCRFESPLAVAPRGLHSHPEPRFERIGVGFDGGAESRSALELAGSIAVAAGASLVVQAVVDDRMPPVGWSGLAKAGVMAQEWNDAIEDQMARRQTDAQVAARATGARETTEVKRGRPADALLELSEHVDLLVIGSRRWGPVARVLLGSTGEALLHDASCAVLVVPRPPE